MFAAKVLGVTMELDEKKLTKDWFEQSFLFHKMSSAVRRQLRITFRILFRTQRAVNNN